MRRSTFYLSHSLLEYHILTFIYRNVYVVLRFFHAFVLAHKIITCNIYYLIAIHIILNTVLRMRSLPVSFYLSHFRSSAPDRRVSVCAYA